MFERRFYLLQQHFVSNRNLSNSFSQIMFQIIAVGLLLVSSAIGNPAKSHKSCRDYTLPFTTNSSNLIWGFPELHDDYDATAFTNDLSRWDANVTFKPVSGIAQAIASYKISGTFCSPTSGEN